MNSLKMSKVLLLSLAMAMAVSCTKNETSVADKKVADSQGKQKAKQMTLDSVSGENYIVYNGMDVKLIYKTNLGGNGLGTLLTDKGSKKVSWAFAEATKTLTLNLQDELTQEGYVTLKDAGGVDVQYYKVCKIEKIEMTLSADIKSVESASCTIEDRPELGVIQDTYEYENTDISRTLGALTGIKTGITMVLPTSQDNIIEVILGNTDGLVIRSLVDKSLTKFTYKMLNNDSELEVTFSNGRVINYKMIEENAVGQLNLAITEMNNGQEILISSNTAVISNIVFPDYTNFAGTYAPVLAATGVVDPDSYLTFGTDGIAELKFGAAQPLFYTWTIKNDVVELTRYRLADGSLLDAAGTKQCVIDKCSIGQKRSFALRRQIGDLLVMYRTHETYGMGSPVANHQMATLYTYKKIK